MLLTFDCPRCGKEYDLPWTLAGKKARCKRCSVEFVIPAPLEPKGPRSSEAIPVFDPSASPKPTGPRPIAAQDPPPNKLLAALRSGVPASTKKLDAPGSREPKAEPASPSSSVVSGRSVSPPTRPMPRPDDPLFPTSPRTSIKFERSRPKPRPRRDDDDFGPDSIDPVTGSRKQPVWLVPAFVIADLVIVLIIVGQLSVFVGDDEDDEPDLPVASAAIPSRERTNIEPTESPEAVASPDPTDPNP